MNPNDILCKTIEDIPEPLRETLLENFSNNRNPNLVKSLRKYKDAMAKYYLMYCDTTPLFYFSLQSSCIFTKPYTPSESSVQTAKRLKNFISRGGKISLDILSDLYQGDPDMTKKINLMSEPDKINMLKKLDDVLSYLSDLHDPDTEDISIYECAFPALEIVEFCKCDSCNSLSIWNSLDLKGKVGEYVFFTYIFPIVINISNQIGCSFVTLYAADSSQDKTLVEYYIRALHLFKPKGVTVNKPKYDLGCILLVQHIERLKELYEEFKTNTNTEYQLS